MNFTPRRWLLFERLFWLPLHVAVQFGMGFQHGEIALMPVRVGWMNFADFVQALNLIERQVPANRREVFVQLLFGAGTKHYRVDRGSLCQPVDGDLCEGLAGLFRDAIH